MSAIKFKILDYIESTGTQYIDTGFKPNQNSGIDIDIDSTNCEGMSYPSPFGSRGNGTTSYNNNQFFVGIQSNEANTTWFLRYGTQTKKTTFGEKYGRNRIVINKNEYTINNDSYTFTATTFQSDYNIFLFGYNCNGSLGQGSNGLFHGKIYSCKIYDNNTLVRDFVPVLDNNNVACLYDKVNNQYYYNQGTGTFTAGNIIGTYTNLIYDRTEEDVEYAKNNQDNSDNLKGAYNYTDLNRIEEWTSDIGNLLNSYGYDVSLTTKTDWVETDFPTKSHMKRIRDNVSTLKNAFISFTNVPENLEKMTYTKANQIEKILEEIYLLIGNMEASFWYSGEINSGEV